MNNLFVTYNYKIFIDNKFNIAVTIVVLYVNMALIITKPSSITSLTLQ